MKLEDLLKKELNREVERYLGVLEDLEERVMERIKSQEQEQERERKGWLSLLLPKPTKQGLAFAATAVVFLLVGLFLGFQMDRRAFDRGEGVLFIVAYPEAESVAVVGDFTHWNPLPLEDPERDGVWTLWIDLKPGRYEYTFVIDGRWGIQDPRADEYILSFGQYNSVKYVKGKSDEET
jgi:hypothetical protein